MQRRPQILMLSSLLLAFAFATTLQAQTQRGRAIPSGTLLRIVKAEDERRWDGDLRSLLSDPNPAIRARAALATGRIGEQGALPELARLLTQDKDQNIRAIAAFGIGEVESMNGSNALLNALKNSTETSEVRARSIEALGKIIGALPAAYQTQNPDIGLAILDAVKSEAEKVTPDRQFVLLGITAILRSKPANAGVTLAKLLSDKDPRIRADAGNALARLRLKEGN